MIQGASLLIIGFLAGFSTCVLHNRIVKRAVDSTERRMSMTINKLLKENESLREYQLKPARRIPANRAARNESMHGLVFG